MPNDSESPDSAHAQQLALQRAKLVLESAISQADAATADGEGSVRIALNLTASALNKLLINGRMAPDAIRHLSMRGQQALNKPRDLAKVLGETLGFELGAHTEQLVRVDANQQHAVDAEAAARKAEGLLAEVAALRLHTSEAARAAKDAASDAAMIAYAKDLEREKAAHQGEAFKLQVAIGGMVSVRPTALLNA